MKRILVFLVIITAAFLLCGFGDQETISASFRSTGCSTPVGTNFTESFGDSSSLCWTAGPSTCNHTWTIAAGTGESIITSPAGAPSNTACSNSLQMIEPNAATAWIDSTFTGVAGNFDLIGTIYISSATGITVGNSNELICITTNGGSCDSSGTIMKLKIENPSGTLQLFGNGVADSAGINITTSTWYTFDLHHDTVLANCSLAINGGAAQTFVCNTGTSGQINIGNSHGGTNATTFVVGNAYF